MNIELSKQLTNLFHHDFNERIIIDQPERSREDNECMTKATLLKRTLKYLRYAMDFKQTSKSKLIAELLGKTFSVIKDFKD